MGNLTIKVDDESLKKARIRALEEGTSVNALLKEFLDAYAGVNRARRQAVNEVLALARGSTARRGGRAWTREELHERK